MHTKGPWELQQVTGGYRIITGGKYTMNLDGPWYPSVEQREAFESNALLIAAAPELLKALDGAINVIESTLSPDEKWLGMDDAKEAIRKAKGE